MVNCNCWYAVYLCLSAPLLTLFFLHSSHGTPLDRFGTHQNQSAYGVSEGLDYSGAFRSLPSSVWWWVLAGPQASRPLQTRHMRMPLSLVSPQDTLESAAHFPNPSFCFLLHCYISVHLIHTSYKFGLQPQYTVDFMIYKKHFPTFTFMFFFHWICLLMLGQVFALIPTFPQNCKIFRYLHMRLTFVPVFLTEKQQKIWGTD